VQQLCHALFLVTTKYRIVRNIQSVQNISFGGGRRQFARASLLLFLAFVAGFIKVLCCPRVLECARAFVCLSVCLCVCVLVCPALPVARSTSAPAFPLPFICHSAPAASSHCPAHFPCGILLLLVSDLLCSAAICLANS